MKSEKGQSMVEFALTIPIVLFLLFGIVDFGRVFHAYLTIDHAGREGARAAAIGNSSGYVETVILDASNSLYDFSNSNITIGEEKVTEGTGTSAKYAVITLNYSVDFITPFLNVIFSPIPIKDTTKMRME